MNTTGSRKRFRVALSFPGEKRDYVEKVAAALAQRFGEEAVLYDRFHTAEFARFNLGFLLPNHYQEDSDLIVVVLCADYEKKEWCGLEWRSIFDLVKQGRDADVMLFRADDAPIRGLYSLDGYAPLDAFTPEAAARLILQRLARNEGKRRDFYLEGGQAPAKPGDFQMAVSKLPQKHDRGVFEGREKVLADLDALWVDSLADKPGRTRIVSLVAIGGAGKTTVASRWSQALLAREGHGGVERYFDWSFYSQGTRTEGDKASAQTAADATLFVAAALQFFGDPELADSPAPAWDKGARLAALVARHRTLLLLDGLEPLQHPPGPQTGELKDDALRALFAGLQSAGRGLCLVTTREPIADLAVTRDTTTPEWRLDHLTDASGAAVLRGHGVIGPQAELEAASREVKGHALTLALMGRYLRLAFDPPDIARRDCFHFSEADAETHNGHAFRVIAAYERWFEGKPVQRGWRARWFGKKQSPTTDQTALAILRLLGLFDHPATPDCLTALCAAPAIPGLTEPLVGLGERQWNTALQRLRELDLIETAEWVPVKVSGYGKKEARAEMAAGQQERITNLGPPQSFKFRHASLVVRQSVDTHPLLREYFEAELRTHGIARAAHARLYEHLCTIVPHWPEGRDGLLPLYQAVAHGCKAGRIEEAAAVYRDRIKRGTVGGHAHYSSSQLGLFGLDLAAVACFFIEPWRRLAPKLTPGEQAWLLNEAALRLRALNRLTEAREPMRAGMEMRVQQENWKNAATVANNLSELELTLGDVPAAEVTAAQSIIFADRSGDAFQRMSKRATHADALHQAGRTEASRTLFAEAETMHAERAPDFPLLFSGHGYLYCDLLLAVAERAAWRRCAGFRPRVRRASRPVRRTRGPRRALLSDLAAIEHRAAQTFEWISAVQTFEWITNVRAPLIAISLEHLTLGRVHLLRAVLESPNAHLPSARTHLDTALATLRQANIAVFMAPALLPCAWLHALVGEWDAARQRLDEAYALCTRGGNPQNGWQGGMRLYLADTLLHRGRLFGWRNEYPWPDRTPKADLDEAGTLIDACGYHRRDQELADARAALR